MVYAPKLLKKRLIGTERLPLVLILQRGEQEDKAVGRSQKSLKRWRGSQCVRAEVDGCLLCIRDDSTAHNTSGQMSMSERVLKTARQAQHTKSTLKTASHDVHIQ